MKKLTLILLLPLLLISCRTLSSASSLSQSEKKLIYSTVINLSSELTNKKLNSESYDMNLLLGKTLSTKAKEFNSIPLFNNYLTTFFEKAYPFATSILSEVNSKITITQDSDLDNIYFVGTRPHLTYYFFAHDGYLIKEEINKLVKKRLSTREDLINQYNAIVRYYNLYATSMNKIEDNSKEIIDNSDCYANFSDFIYNLYIKIMSESETSIRLNAEGYNNKMLTQLFGVKNE